MIGLTAAAFVLVACPRGREERASTPSTAAQESARVVGNEARGLDDQPDYEAMAQALRERVEPAVVAATPASAELACRAMWDGVIAQSIAREGEDAAATLTWQRARAAGEAECIETTSPAAATCVAHELPDARGEFPWVLDQCSRAFPAPPKPPPSAQASPDAAPTRGPLKLAFVGDVIFGRYRESGYDPIPEGDFKVFEEVAPLLAADVLVGNLETPLLRELPAESPIGARFQFGASLEHARALSDAKFSVMSLANNHWFDLRAEGARETPKLLAELGILAVGAATEGPGGPQLRVEPFTVAGWNIAFFAVTARTNAPLREGLPQPPYVATSELASQLGPLLEQAAATAHLRIVLVHWGDEYLDQPNSTQTRAAHGLIRAGADLVIGHHPHVLQGVEVYEDGLIAYSLGNFLFENTNEIPRLTGVLHVEVDPEGRLCGVVFRPAYLKRHPVQRPVPASGGMARRVKDRVRGVSRAFGTAWEDAGDDLRLPMGGCTEGAKADGSGAANEPNAGAAAPN